MTKTVINLTKAQSLLYNCNSRNIVGCYGRRSGKSTTALMRIAKKALTKSRSLIWYIGPTYGQVEQILWPTLKQHFPRQLVRKVYESKLSLELINGSRIELKGANQPDNLRGSMIPIDHVTLDEFAFYQDQEYVWTSLRPVLSDGQATLDIYSTPKGYDKFYEMYQKGVNGDLGWTSFHCDSIKAGILKPEEIEIAKEEMGFLQFQQEYMAAFNSSVAQIYYAFADANIVKDDSLDFNWDKPIYIGLDFNVSKMCAVVGQKEESKKELHVIDEIVLYNSNTFKMMDEIKSRFPQAVHNRITIVPDASGRSDSTNSFDTNFDIIRRAGFKLYDFRKNPRVEDSINEVNGLLYNANNKRRFYVNSKCKELIKTLRTHEYAENGGPDKSKGLDHIGDANRYLVHATYPFNGVKISSAEWRS